jgi:hypothetical protein
MKWFAAALAALLIGGLPQRASRADDGPPTATSWELSPQRVQLTVYVDPSPRLSPSLEADLPRKLAAQASVVLGGPYQFSANNQLAALKSRMLIELPRPESPNDKLLADKVPQKAADKLLFMVAQEQQGAVTVTAREYDQTCRVWNVPVTRRLQQANQVEAEALSALVAALAPLGRIDSEDSSLQDKGFVRLKLKGSRLPKRDGTLLVVDEHTVLRPIVVRQDANGATQSATIIPSTFLVPASEGAGGSSSGSLRYQLHSGLRDNLLPAYHPHQPRLALGVVKSELPTRLKLVDAADESVPLEGYDVLTQSLAGDTSAPPNKVGSTDRRGELNLPGMGLSRLIIARGDEHLMSTLVMGGLQAELQVSIPSDRRRLELSAELAEFQDELVDLAARQAVTALRLQEGLKKADIALVGKLSEELKNALTNHRLEPRLAEVKKSLASADEATRQRLQPQITQAEQVLEQLRAVVEKLP